MILIFKIYLFQRHGRKSAEKKKKEQKANVKEEEKEEEKVGLDIIICYSVWICV